MSEFLISVASSVVSAVLIGALALVFKEPLKRWWSDRTSVNQQFFRWLRREVKRKGRTRFTIRCQVFGRHVWEYQEGRPAPDATPEWLAMNPYVIHRCSRCGERRNTLREDVDHAAS